MKTKKLKHPLLILLIIVISTSNIFAQRNKRGLQYRQISTIDIVLGGDFGFRIISGNSSDSEIEAKIDNRNESEDIRLSYRFGVNYNHAIGPNLLIKTGFRYSNPGFLTGSIEQIDPAQDINSIQKIYEPQSYEYRYKYQLVGIPLGLRYVFKGSWCKSYVELGVIPTMYLSTIIEEREYESTSRDFKVSEDINKFNYFGFFATGGDFIITEKLSGFSQLIAHYQLNNLRKGGLDEKLLSLGVELGLRCHL